MQSTAYAHTHRRATRVTASMSALTDIFRSSLKPPQDPYPVGNICSYTQTQRAQLVSTGMAGHEETGTSGEEVLYTVSQTQHLMDPPQFVYQDSEWRFESLHSHLQKSLKTHAKALTLTFHLQLIWCNPAFLQTYWR